MNAADVDCRVNARARITRSRASGLAGWSCATRRPTSLNSSVPSVRASRARDFGLCLHQIATVSVEVIGPTCEPVFVSMSWTLT